MPKRLKRLQLFVESEERTPKDIYEYIRFCEPEAVTDLRKMKTYLFKDFDDSAKAYQLLAAVRVKGYLAENRDHNGRMKRPYDVYKLLYPQGTILEKHFNEVFEIFDAVELTDETGDINASKTVARWRELGESRESILRFLKTIAASNSIVPDLYQLSDGAANGQVSKKEFFETVKLFAKSGPSGTIDALCALDFGEKSDVPLENTAVYYSVSSALREGDSVLVIEPSCAFVRKWMLDEYIRNCPVTFAVSDKEICSVLAGHYKAMKYARFVMTDDIAGVIEETTLNHIVIFGARYFEISTLVHAIKEKAKGNYRVSVLAPDLRFFKGALHKEICDGRAYDRTVTLFPSGISGATSPQRKLLFKFAIGDSESRAKDTAVKIGAYSLLKGKPQKLQKKILTVSMPLWEFADGRSFREAFREKELGVLQKTERKRAKAYEIPFSEDCLRA